jgi:hypothetical protein
LRQVVQRHLLRREGTKHKDSFPDVSAALSAGFGGFQQRIIVSCERSNELLAVAGSMRDQPFRRAL